MVYNLNDGYEGHVACPTPKSEIDTCPSGSAINIRFRECTFETVDITFECFGHWVGLDNQNYLVLMNTRSQEKLGPQYRCATYSEDPKTGVVQVTFSNDSTCTPLAKKGKETGNYVEMMKLYPVAYTNWPQATSYCRFPKWMMGRWQYLKLQDENTLVFNDHSSFKTHTMKCLENNRQESDRFLVYSQTQCGEQNYYCVEIKKRSTNILEFQIGSLSSQTYNSEICDDAHFDDDRWLTQGRSEFNSSLAITPCPVSGDFTGFIPDALGLCAKLSSECKSQDLMYYEVSACDYDEIYEEREYRCLGQWEEKGVVFVYTQRRDIDAYECFVGVMMSDKKIFIKEAGEHCQRNLNPYKHGMELHKMAYCNDVSEPKTMLSPSEIPTETVDRNSNSIPRLITTTSTMKNLIHVLSPSDSESTSSHSENSVEYGESPNQDPKTKDNDRSSKPKQTQSAGSTNTCNLLLLLLAVYNMKM